MKTYIMALDQGTTSCRCVLYDRQGKIVSMAQKEFRQIYPEAGWVEHDAMEIWSTQMGVAQEALLKIDGTYKNIRAIGITNQRETTVVWDKETGRPIYNAIVWQCRRTARYCDELKSRGLTETFQEKTGLLIDPYFSATKLRWILENVEGAREKAEQGQLLFGTIETWLIWKMTNGKVHVTDYSNASRTMLFNINTLKWDEDILKELDIPACMLPEPVASSQVYGKTDTNIFGGSIAIAGAAGDQQAALFGQTCFQAGEAKNTYGTGGFLLMNTGERPVYSQNGLLTTIAWGISGSISYALEGSVFICGAAIQWLRDELEILENAAESENMAVSVPDSNGIYVVPAFVGLGAPYWDPYARGAVLGLTRGVNKNHLVRATLESMAYQTNDLIKVMVKDMGKELVSLRVDGGASANDFLMQFQCDILGRPVLRPKSIETTSLGAAYLAGLACGYWDSREDIRDNWRLDREFRSNMEASKRGELLAGWEKSVNCVLGWTK